MAASALDKARKSYSYLQKTLNGGISDTDTTLTPNNVTNIPTDTGVSFVIDRVDSTGTKTPTKRELMTGRVLASTITGLIRGEQGTTAQAHLNNAVIEFVNSGEMWNDLIDFMLQDHENPNGNHKTLTDTNGNEWLERGLVASAVNHVKATNAITAGAPRLDASGDDTNVDLYLGGKGTGVAHVENSETIHNYVASGGVLAIVSGATGNFSNIVYYIAGKRYKKSSVANKVYTINKDTYVDVDTAGNVTYTEVATSAAAPALAANSIRLAKVVTNATVITVIQQDASDSLNNLIYPEKPGTKRVDANGWTVYNYGGFREYKKRVTWSQSIGGLASLSISSNTLPYGIGTIGSHYFNYTGMVSGQAGIILIVFEGGTGSSFINFTTARTDGAAAAALNGVIDMVLTTS